MQKVGLDFFKSLFQDLIRVIRDGQVYPNEADAQHLGIFLGPSVALGLLVQVFGPSAHWQWQFPRRKWQPSFAQLHDAGVEFFMPPRPWAHKGRAGHLFGVGFCITPHHDLFDFAK